MSLVHVMIGLRTLYVTKIDSVVSPDTQEVFCVVHGLLQLLQENTVLSLMGTNLSGGNPVTRTCIALSDKQPRYSHNCAVWRKTRCLCKASERMMVNLVHYAQG